MKDIYSPLDIDEEWDNMAPMVDAPVMGGAEGATAVAVKPDEGTADMNAMMPVKEEATSTLPPVAESNAMTTDTMPATPPLVNEGLKEDTASQDAAFEVANADMGAAMNTDGKLNIGEINPAATETTDTTVTAKAPTPVPVIDMNEASAEMNSTGEGAVEVGKSFTPEEKPAEDRFAGMETEEKEEAPKEEKPEASKEEPAAAELPVTPAENKELKFDKDDVNKPEVSNTRLESLMSEWADMKKRTQDRLNDLRKEIDEKIRKLEEEIKAKEDAMAKAEAERDDIDAKLNELV